MALRHLRQATQCRQAHQVLGRAQEEEGRAVTVPHLRREAMAGVSRKWWQAGGGRLEPLP
ncbi:hypothetical protein OF001_U40180 [Pseudomonas sp. OF001]|nr:hypothetical protein OF001_U40180 [Pseudomonas sp. OF001]